MKEEQSTVRYHNIKIRKCSNDLHLKMQELENAVEDLLQVGESPWIDYKDIMESLNPLNWSLSKIKKNTAQLESQVEICELRANGVIA